MVNTFKVRSFSNVKCFLIEASLSEPHTSVTALHTCVCMLVGWFVGLFGPTTYRKFQMSAFKYFTTIECPRVHAYADVHFS